MSQITNTFRVTLVSLMIVSGAINTIGTHNFSKLINFKINNLYSKEASINISSTPTSKYTK